MERPPRYCLGRRLSKPDEDFLAWFWVALRRIGRARRCSAAIADRAFPPAGRLLLRPVVGEDTQVADRASQVRPAHRRLAAQRGDPAPGEVDFHRVYIGKFRDPGADGCQADNPGGAGGGADLRVGVYLDTAGGLKPIFA